MCFDMKKHVYSDSEFNMPYIEIKQNVKKIASDN